MDEISEQLQNLSFDTNAKKRTSSPWLAQFENENKNNDQVVNESREKKSNYDNSSFGTSRDDSFSNDFEHDTVRGRGLGLNNFKRNNDQNEPFNCGHNSNFTNNRGTFTSSNRGHGRGFVKRFDNENVTSGNEHKFNNFNNRGNYTTSSYRSHDQGGSRRFNGENRSFKSGNNGSYNNGDGGNFESGRRDRSKRLNSENESVESGDNGSFNNRNNGGNKSFNNRNSGNFESGYQNRGKRFNNENASFESGNNGSFNHRDGSNNNNNNSGYQNRSKRFNNKNVSFGSDNNGSFNNRDGNFASGNRGHRNESGDESREQFNGGNSLYENRRNGDNRNDSERSFGPKIDYIPPDFESDGNFAGIVAGQNFDNYDTIEVKVSGTDPPKRLTSFADSGLQSILLKNLALYNFCKPTPVQNYAIPIIMAGRDLMASAQTGSGKTAAYALPIIHRLLSQSSQPTFDKNHCEPQVVIVAPTRELVIQINRVVWKFTNGTSIKCKFLYGGTSIEYQISKLLEYGVHILTATTGRLLYFLKKNIVNLSSLNCLVLDEADRMLDMGFKKDIEYILNHSIMNASNDRQTVMFSATFPAEIQRMATQFLKSDYLFVAIGEVGAACKDVVQTVQSVNRFDKKKTLLNLLQEMETCDRTIVFVEQKRNADYVASYLSENDFPTTSIHGDREQPERELALKDFTSNKMKILVATVVAARGLDIEGVTNVINFDLPRTVDEYVHRIGRTGRLGNAGKAISFFDPEYDRSLAPDFIRILQQADQEVPQWLLSMAENTQAAVDVDDFCDIRTDVGVVCAEIEEEYW